MISVKWMAAFVLCQTVFCIEKPYRLVKNTTCLEMDDQNRLSCKKSEEYHCLLDENYFNEYEVCREWKWIPKGKCAYFNTYNRGNVDERDCEQKPGYTCASDQHRSTQSRNYDACYVKKEITTQVSPISTSSRVDNSSSGENSSLVEQTTPSHPGSVIGITFGFLIPVILAAFVILLLRKEIFQHCRKDSTKEKENNRDIEGHPNVNAPLFEGNEQDIKWNVAENNEGSTEKKENNRDIEGHPNVNAPLFDGNEQDIKQNVAENNEDLDKTDVEKGKKEAEGNESKETKRSSPVEDIEGTLAKKNMEEAKKPSEEEGNDEDGSTMNEEGNGGDGSTKNDKGNKEVGSTKNKEGSKEERSTNNEEDDEENTSTNNVEGNEEDGYTKNKEDDEENGSTNNEDTGGVFDGSLESIKKKEDGLQQAGTDKFLELLKCGTIQTTKKILLNVVKENVADYPQRYQQNESEKEMVRELLPEDSKGFINSDFDSVAVSYAILRLSLKKEHQPKSGWGQGIKDTDIGLGDDVERLYKVYTLWKGIQSAEEVTVNEYVKLYEMLIDAFQRLGKREDYQEFVTGCANLQRKLWYMDKLKTLKRFLPNWSWESGDSN